MTHPSADHWFLLPGTLCTPDVAAPVLDDLGGAAANRIAIELNSSHLQEYRAPLNAVVTDGAIVCGFSLDAIVAALNLPALARGKAIVLLASYPFLDPASNRANRDSVRDHVLAEGARDWVTENWHVISAGLSSNLLDKVASMAEITTHLNVARTELAACRPGAAEQLAATNVPSVFVTGSMDQLTAPELMHPIAERGARAVLKIPDGLGHFGLLEAPDQVASAFSDGLTVLFPQTNPES